MPPLRSLIFWPWHFLRHAFLGGNHPNCRGLIRQGPTFMSLLKRTSKHPRRHSDFKTRELPTLRLFHDNTIFSSRYLPLSTLLVLLRRPRKPFLYLLSSTVFNVLSPCTQNGDTMWFGCFGLLFWYETALDGVVKKSDGAPFLFWNCYEVFDSKLSNILVVSVCVAVKEKGKKEITVDARWFRHTTEYCVFRYTIRYHARLVQYGPLFFLPKWKLHGTNTTPAGENTYMTNSG